MPIARASLRAMGELAEGADVAARASALGPPRSRRSGSRTAACRFRRRTARVGVAGRRCCRSGRKRLEGAPAHRAVRLMGNPAADVSHRAQAIEPAAAHDHQRCVRVFGGRHDHVGGAPRLDEQFGRAGRAAVRELALLLFQSALMLWSASALERRLAAERVTTSRWSRGRGPPVGEADERARGLRAVGRDDHAFSEPAFTLQRAGDQQRVGEAAERCVPDADAEQFRRPRARRGSERQQIESLAPVEDYARRGTAGSTSRVYGTPASWAIPRRARGSRRLAPGRSPDRDGCRRTGMRSPPGRSDAPVPPASPRA